MATPALLERISGEDTGQYRKISGHDMEAAIMAIHGGGLTVPELKTNLRSTTDDDTDIDNIVDLVTNASGASAKNKMVFKICGIISLLGGNKTNADGTKSAYLTAAQARGTARLDIATP